MDEASRLHASHVIRAAAASGLTVDAFESACVEAGAEPSSRGTCHAILAGRRLPDAGHWHALICVLSPEELGEAYEAADALDSDRTGEAAPDTHTAMLDVQSAVLALVRGIDEAVEDGEWDAREVARCMPLAADLRTAADRLDALIGMPPRVVSRG